MFGGSARMSVCGFPEFLGDRRLCVCGVAQGVLLRRTRLLYLSATETHISHFQSHGIRYVFIDNQTNWRATGVQQISRQTAGYSYERDVN